MTLSYAPYYFFGFLSPLVLLLMEEVTGWQIAYEDSEVFGDTAPASGGTASAVSGED